MKRTIKTIVVITLVLLITVVYYACDLGSTPDIIPATWQGTWTGTGSFDGTNIVFTGTTIRENAGSNYAIIGNISITDASLPHNSPGLWPNSYKINGILIAASGEMAEFVGNAWNTDIYFNANYTQFVMGYMFVAPNIYTK